MIIDTVNGEEDECLWSKFVTRRFSKWEIIKHYDRIERYLNVIVKGAVGTFARGPKEDICINLTFENETVTDYLSVLQQKPTPIKTVALEDCEVLSISHNELYKAYESNPYNLYIPKTGVEIMYIKKYTEQIDCLTLSPEQRYERLMELRPHILERVPFKIIASYLKLTPQSFSRMKRRYEMK
ncbi:Crp/Fnr family transcriptional regulator [Taibaiella soli]|uniref:Crp/Fnr family transcriptional regulator n=2 Tax=Taibaiella soli TaxID=1649169 RepID=A0A2W2ATH4_9BACT|nr:Crp/Fnr family transcriptional regulator [Taibaiella soli]